MTNENIGVKCPQCGKVLKVRKPSKPGTYQIACSDCGHTIKLQLRAQPIKMEEKPAAPVVEKKKQQVPVLGKAEPIEGKDGVYHIKTPANINQPYAFLCPQCGKPVLMQATKPGVKAVPCKLCGTKTYLKVVDPAAVAAKKVAAEQAAAEKANAKKKAAEEKAKKAKKKKVATDEQVPAMTVKVRNKDNKSTGMLTWGNIFRRKKLVLNEGIYTIGRKDDTYPSDIQFDDAEMSRRSVVLEVSEKNGGFFYKLTVKKAMNPVLHNNQELAEDESVYLNYGDAFQLGRTVIHFKKVDK